MAALTVVAFSAQSAVVPAATATSGTLAHASTSAVLASSAAGNPSTNHATFGIGPARGKRPDPSRPYLNYVTKPGARLRDHVILVNFSTFPIRLDVYPTDAVVSDTGSFGLSDATARPRDAGAWITVRTPHRSGRVRVPARSSVVLPVRVHVPKKASPGDHAAGVVAAYSSTPGNRRGANVRLVQRVGTRVFIRVRGPLHPSLTVQQLGAHYVKTWNPVGTGSAVVTYRVANTGNIKLGTTQQVQIRGPFGTTGQATPRPIPLLLPGDHVDVRVVVTGVVPQVWMTASVHLTPLVPGDTDTGLQVWSSSTHFWAVPWLLLAVLVAAAGCVWWWWRRRHRPPAVSPVATSHSEELAGRQGG
jgi:hypothetical protein